MAVIESRRARRRIIEGSDNIIGVVRSRFRASFSEFCVLLSVRSSVLVGYCNSLLFVDNSCSTGIVSVFCAMNDVVSIE